MIFSSTHIHKTKQNGLLSFYDFRLLPYFFDRSFSLFYTLPFCFMNPYFMELHHFLLYLFPISREFYMVTTFKPTPLLI